MGTGVVRFSQCNVAALVDGSSQMAASWQWANFVEDQSGEMQRTVYVNMDETMIRLWQGGRRDLVKIEPFAKRRVFLDREERGTLAERRQNCSMIAFISDCPKAQELLPLILLLNEHHVTKTAAQPIVDEFAGDRNVVFLRRKSAWNSTDLMIWMVKDLRQRLAPLEPLAQVVLLLDCAPCHAHPRVAHAAARNKIILVFLAASMTASLQPLDVFVFAALKKYIADAYERVVLDADGGVDTPKFVSTLLHTARDFICGQNWERAFRGCGFGAGQSGLTDHLRSRFPHLVPPGGGARDLPTLQQLQIIWPARREIPIGWLFSWVSGEEVPALPPPPATAVSKSTQPGHPWFGRLRSSSALASSAAPAPSVLTPAQPWPPAATPSSTSTTRLVRPLRSLPKAVSRTEPLARARPPTPRCLAPPPPPSTMPMAVSAKAMATPRTEPLARARPPPPQRRLVPVGRPLGLLRPTPRPSQ